MIWKEVLHQKYIKCEDASAETLVLIHGLGLDMTIWDETIPKLKENFHLLLFDLPGHGKSPFPTHTPLTWNLLIDCLEQMIDFYGIDSFHLIGHSGGGNIGIEALSKINNRIKSITLISTPLLVPKDLATDVMTDRMDILHDEEKEEMVNQLIPVLCYPLTLDKKRKLQSIYAQITSALYQEYFLLLGKKILSYTTTDIQEIDKPTLILIGEKEALYPLRLQAMNFSFMEDAKIYVIPDAANIPMMDRPELFSKLVKKFINNNAVEKTEVYYTETLNTEIQKVMQLSLEEVIEEELVEIQMIDEFKVLISGMEVSGKWNQRKAKEIFTYLAINKRVTREKLVDTFWPNTDVQKGKNQLRVSLNHIKKILASQLDNTLENYLHINREYVELKAKVRIDYQVFLEQLEVIEKEELCSEKVDAFITEIHSLPDPLFPFFYDDWIQQIRFEVENQIVNSCRYLLNTTISEQQSAELLKIMSNIQG